MTETEWLTSVDPAPMLEYLWRRASDRKSRLLRCACCRGAWNFLTDNRSRSAVETAERYADGLASNWELLAARRDAQRVEIDETVDIEVVFIAKVLRETRMAVQPHARIGPGETWAVQPSVAAALLRDLFNPFRPAPVENSLLVWNDATIPKMAQSIYDARAFDRLPLLADALEEAGCADADILSHCRTPGEHVRGCWVVDLLLGKS